MLETQDDYVAHRPQTDDLGWFDRFYLNVHSPKSNVTLSMGMGTYPQNGVIDGYSVLVDGPTQRNLRVSLLGEQEPTRTTAGPLVADVVEPMKTWRMRLGPNDTKLTYDLTFHGDLAPIDAGRMHKRSKRTGALLDFSHFVQMGKAEGWIDVDGKRLEVTPDTWFSLRDRSWGIRPVTGGTPNEVAPHPTDGKHDWCLARLGDKAAFYILGGSPGRPPVFLGAGVATKDGAEKVVSVDRVLDWSPDGRFQGVRSTLTTEKGEKVELRIKERKATLYLRGAGYGGLNGHQQGEKRGSLVVEGETWRMDDRDLLNRMTGLNDHVCEFEGESGTGFGIYEVASGT